MTYKFSPSNLNILKDCPKCFWLQHKRGIKRPDSIFPSLPSGMDRIIKNHFDTYRAKNELPPEMGNLDGVKLYSDTDKLKIFRNNFKGIQYTDEKGNLYRGAVDDLLETSDGKIIVLDYKTRGYPLKDDTHKHYQNQLDIYNYLLRKNGFETEDYGYLLFFHPDKVDEKGNVVFHTDLIKVNTSVENAEKIFEKALVTLDGKIPEASNECGYCKWIENNVVDASKRN